MNNKTWQDIMIYHREEGTAKHKWVLQSQDQGVLFCGRLCDTILALEAENDELEHKLDASERLNKLDHRINRTLANRNADLSEKLRNIREVLDQATWGRSEQIIDKILKGE